MGRPKIANPKSERITVRLNQDDLSKLKDCCNFYGLDKAEIVRKGIRQCWSKIKK